MVWTTCYGCGAEKPGILEDDLCHSCRAKKKLFKSKDTIMEKKKILEAVSTVLHSLDEGLDPEYINKINYVVDEGQHDWEWITKLIKSRGTFKEMLEAYYYSINVCNEFFGEGKEYKINKEE